MARKNQILEQETAGLLCLSSEDSEEIDLSYWEFINPSDADDDEIDNLSLESINDDCLFVSWHSSVANSIIAQEKSHFDEEKSVIDDVGVGFVGGFVEEQLSFVNEGDCYYDDDHGYDGCGDDDDDDGVGGGYDLDDELVPWALSGKLERQRMRKLGKRAFAKISTSKRAPFSYVKPGAVRGKHGLGMKYSC